MSFCFLYNVVSENYSVQNSPWGGGGGGRGVYCQLKVYFETVFQSISGRLPKRGRKRREKIEESKNV